MGRHTENGTHENNITELKFTVISSHFIEIFVLIAGLIVYVIMTNTYQHNLEILRNVCDLSYHSARSAAIGYNFFVYDKRYNFTDPIATDEWTSTMVQKKELMKMLEDTSDSLASMLDRIHQSTTNLEVWETADISTYLFSITTKNETQQDGNVEEVINTKRQILHSSSMLEVIAMISQITHHLHLSNISSRPQDPEYIANIQYLVFNCPVPILDGAKRVIIYYFELMNADCNKIITVFVLIIITFLSPLTVARLAIFIIFTRRAVMNRMRAYQSMLDVPKNKMQSVIRRLLRDDDTFNDFTINQSLNQFQDMKSCESCCNNKYDKWDEVGMLLFDEDIEESMPNNNSKKVACNSIQTPFMNDSSLTEINSNSMSVRQASMESQQERKAFLKQNAQKIELSNTKSVSSMISGAESSKESTIDTPFSLSSLRSPFGERTPSTPSTPGLQFQLQSPISTKDNVNGIEMTEQNIGTRISSQTLPSNNDSFLRKAKTEARGMVSEVQSNHSKNDASPTDRSQFNANEVPIADQWSCLTNGTDEDARTVGTNTIQKGSTSKIQFNPILGTNTNSSVYVRRPLVINQNDDLINASQSQVVSLSFFSENANQSHNGLMSTGSISTHQTILEQGTSSTPNSIHIMSPISPTIQFQQNSTLAYRKNLPLPQIEVPSPILVVNDIYMKTERNISDTNEALMHNQQQHLQQQNNVANSKYTFYEYDDEDAEKNRRMGLIRNAIEDTAWEEGMEKEIEKYAFAYKQLPSPVTKKIIITTVLSMILGIHAISTAVALVSVYVTGYKPTSANIILSGMRASILLQIQFLLTSILQPIPMLKTDQSIKFPRSYNPVMHNSSHCSGSQVTARDMLVPMSKYFEAVHLDCHFGDSDYTLTNDFTYDSVPVTRMKTKFNKETLMKEVDCFLANSDDCSQDPFRMYGVKGSIYGLTTLLARMRINLEKISKMDVDDITFLNPEARFVLNALRNDIIGGINKMTNMILTEGKTEVKESVTILVAAIVFFYIMFQVSMFGNGLTWVRENMHIENVSGKLRKLLPIAEGEKEIEMMPSMVTGHDSFDKGREAILENAQQLLSSINENEHYETLMATFFQLSSTVFEVFNEEEREMVVKNYEGIEKHKREHLLLRQRLTLIGDQLLSKNDAVKAAGKRIFVSLFDVHFTDEDITFVDATYALGFNEGKNVEIGNNNNLPWR
eukprot:MONOS_12267.1-p1 / transcript=MONOS_12267.1 / gene=MONOS_12267 / organism=Monocercomonoides_exilis_PA203 / gene_product=unspecified product / transcript_product=unspecified product / location=Mono_scaffold00668:12365-15958(-) / protein_length=1198 / sequence_SO=supercontig / SO=protein_coding / is_pseudo=false